MNMPTQRIGIQSSNPYFQVYSAVPAIPMIGVRVRNEMLIQSFFPRNRNRIRSRHGASSLKRELRSLSYTSEWPER